MKFGNIYKNMKILNKMMTFYIINFILLGSILGGIFAIRFTDIIDEKIKNSALQFLEAHEQIVNNSVMNVSNASKLVINNQIIQNYLKNKLKSKFMLESPVKKEFISIMGSFPYIKSIYIYDIWGDEVKLENSNSIFPKDYLNIYKETWINEVINKKGGYVIKSGLIKSDGLKKENLISIIRVINDIDSQKIIGIVIINFSSNQLLGLGENVNDTNINTSIVDKQGEIVVGWVNSDVKNYMNLQENNLETEPTIIRKGNKVIAYKKLGISDWILVKEESISKLVFEISSLFKFVILFFIIFIVLLFWGNYFMARSITKPIQKLTKTMKKFKERKFEKLEMNTGQDEIGELKDGFNLMSKEIEDLIYSLIKQEKAARKAELSVMQEQIKPHFLYNTLDTIAYLSLTDKRENVYKAIESLGSYYRNSLSHGNEKIEIEKEVKIVQDYLNLQKLRYGELFDSRYEIDNSLKSKIVLKLILQPLAENALYHGIKPLGEGGIITIKVYQKDSYIVFEVIDNGIGIPEELIKDILKGDRVNNFKSFGLRRTIERINRQYELNCKCEIISQVGKGTTIRIMIRNEACIYEE